jgi:hypothetical protein
MCVPETQFKFVCFICFNGNIHSNILSGGVGRDRLPHLTSLNFQVLIVNNRQYVAVLLFSLVKQHCEWSVNCNWYCSNLARRFENKKEAGY